MAEDPKPGTDLAGTGGALLALPLTATGLPTRSRLSAPSVPTNEAIAGFGFWRCLLALLLLLAPLLAAAAEQPRQAQPKGSPIPLTFFYESFAGAGSLLNFNGNAYINGTELRLTESAPSQAGSAFNNRRVQLGADYSFSSYFTFRMLNPGGSGADGLTFTVQTSSNSAVTVGGGLGYAGINNSIAVEFDTFLNGGGDADGNHVAIDINGDVSHNVYTAAQGYYVAYGNEFANGSTYHVWVDYNGATQTMEVRVAENSNNRSTAPLLLNKSGINLASILGTNQAFVGFTAATGGSWETHDIQTWYFQNRYEPIDTSGGNTYVQASSDATLSSLVTSQGSLSPAFSSGVFSYTVNVANAVSSITVTPTVSNAAASVSVNGVAVTSGTASGQIALNVGNNTITVLGVAENGSTQPYTLTVVRAPGAPTVSATAAASSITQTSATSGGTVTADGGAAISQRGVVYGTSPAPTTANAVVAVGGTVGSFSAGLTGLTPGLTYYVRAFATNSAGTAYGPEISFATLPEVTLSPGTYTFPPTAANGSGAAQSFSFANNGSVPVSIGTATVGGAPFSKGSDSCSGQTLVAGASCAVTALYSPTNASSHSGSLVVPITSPAVNSYTASLSGTSFLPTVQLDFSGSFNARITRNTAGSACNFDAANRCFVSSGVALANSNASNQGLPDDGFFASTAAHPDMQLAAFNGTGNDAWKATAVGTYPFAISTLGNYNFLHVIATSGGASPSVSGRFQVRLKYSDGSNTLSTTYSVPDWFGSLTGTGVYYLRDGMDRWDGSYQNVNNPAVFGFAVPVDNSKLLNGIDIVITDLPGGVTFAMLGATATVESSTAVNSAPFVSTTSPSAVGPFAASSGGNVFDGGSTAVTARGVAYGTSPSPSLGGASVASGSGTGSFSSSLTGLLPATTYFLRAFATNSVGTGYGEEVSFTTLRAPTTTSITGTSVGASSQTNQAVTVDVGVAGFDPSGTVTVRARRADNAIVASCVATLGAVTSGSASGSCTLAAGSLKAGAGITHLSASYAGDTNDDSSVSGNFGFAVARGGVTISSVVVDTSGDRNAVSGEPITVTVSLAAVAPAVGPVTGDGTGAPDLTISTSEAGTGCSIDWDVATECTLVFTGVNNTSQLLAAVNDPDPKRAAVAKATLAKTLQVSFAETDDFNGAGPTAADGVNVSSAPTTTVLSTRALSGPVNSVAGEGVRLTATVATDAPSTIPPRGRVLFTRDATVLGQVTLTAGPGNTATAEFVAPARPVGTETYFAFFLNNDDFIGSDDDAEHSTVKAATSTTISSVLPASPQALQTVTVSASVAAVAPGAGTPTGTITIAGTDTTGCVITLPATSCELSFASQGSKTLTATYGGDGQFLASGASSDTETVTVVGIPVTLTLTGSTPSPHYYGTAYTVSYTLAGGDGSFGGDVTVTAAPGGASCTGTVTGSGGSCEIVVPNGDAGAYTLTGAYAGDGTDATATSASLNHTISQATTALTLSGDTVDPVDAAELVTVSLNLTMPNGVAPLAGTIAVSGANTTGCSITLTGGETMPRTCQLSFSAVGNNGISATFTPSDAVNVAGSTSNTITYEVVRALTTTAITGFAPASGTAQVGDAVTVSFAVTGGVQPYGGAATVEFGAGPTACTPVSFNANTGVGSCEIPATALQLAGDYAVRAAYAGDADDVPSEDSATLTLSPRATATTLASTPASSEQAGLPVTWTVGVSAVGGAATTPISGTVFVCPSSAPSCDANTDVCAITLPSTSCSLSYDLPQTVELVARYAGDANYAASTSSADSISIEKRTSTIAITSDLSAQTPAGAPVTVAFNVDGGHQTYDGQVTVTATLASPAATATCGPVSVNPATGVGSCVIEGAAGFVRAGTWSVVASYAGDDNDTASTSAAVTHPVGPATTEIVLVSNPDPSRYGEPFSLTATVTSSTGIVPTGQVEFFNHLGVSMGFVSLNASGLATLNAPANLPVGVYSGSTSPFRAFKAVFIENADFDTSVDPSETHTIGAADVGLTITSNSPTLAASAADFSIEVSTQSPAQGAPTGSVSLSIVGPAPSTVVAATCSGLALSANGANSSSASCSRVLAEKGSYLVSATYDNVDGNYADIGSASGQITHVVEGVPTSLSLAATVPPAPVYGQSVDIPFTVSGGVTPFLGTVSVSIDGSEICAAAAVNTTTGAGICAAYLPANAGGYNASAAYSGDIDEASSTATSSFTVAKQTPTVGLSLSPDPVSAGATLTATVTVGTTGTVSPPTGTITVSTGGSESGCSVPATGGSCSLTLTATGARTLTASYAGDDNFNGDSDTASVTVNASTTTATIGAISPASPVVGEPITISFSLAGGVAPYSGDLDFDLTPPSGPAIACPGLLFDANTGSGTCTLVTGLATAGAYGLSLSYAGDSNEGPGSDTDSVTVGAASASLSLSSGGSSVVGQSVSVSALVSRLAPATGFAEGSVQITATGPAPSTATQTCAIAALASGAGSCSFTFSQVGSYSLSASYTSADGNTQSIAGPAGTISHSVERALATISLGSVLPASPRVGQSTTVRFSVAGGFGGNSGLVDISTSSSGGAGPGCSGLAANAGTCVLSFAAAGSYTVTATYNASGSDGDDSIGVTDVLAGLTVQPAEGGLDVTVSDTTPEAGQSVTLGATVQTVGGTPATGTITVTRGGSPVCTITLPSTSCTVSFGSIGNAPLDFAYSCDANYAAATTSVPLTVSPAATTLTLGTISPTSLLAGQSSTVNYSVSGGFAGNTGTVVVTATSGSNSATCSAPASAGSCAIALARAGVWSFAATYNASGSDVDDAASSASSATPVSVTRTPTVTVLTVDPAAGGPFGTTVTLSAQVDRNAPGVGQPQGMVTFLVDGASIGEAPLSPSGLSVFSTSTLPVGSRVLRAQYNGNDDYLVSFDEKTFEVSRKAVTLAITGSSVNPSAIAESVVFSYSASTAPGTTLSGSITLTASTGESCTGTIAAGQCAISFSTGGNRSVTASYAGDALHAPASSAAFAHSVAGTPTTLVFASGNPASATFGELVSIATQLSGGTAPNQGLVTVTASAAGQSSVSCSAAVSAGGSSCSLAGLSAGTWSVSASYAGDADDAGSNTAAPISLVINPASQTIVFGAAPSLVFNGPAGTLSATGGASGNPVVFGTSTPSVCSVVGTQVTPLAAGSCIVTANQTGSANYSAAAQATQTIPVAQASQTIVFGAAPSLVFNGPAGTLSATGGASGNPVVFGTSTPSVCSVSGTQVTPLAVGSCIVTANQAGNANYAAAAEVTQTLVIGNGSQTITFGPNPGPLTFGGPVAQVSATASSGLPVSFGTSSPSVCTISGTGATTASLTILTAGSCVVTANQAGNGSFSAAPQVTQSVQIDRASQTITFAALANAVAGSGPIALNASASSGLAVSFGTPSSASVCTVNSGAGTVTPVGPGTCVVEASQAGNGNYQAASPVSRSFTVTAAQLDLSMVKTGRYLAGGLIQWNLAIGNAGPGAASAATVLDSLPAAVTGATWTCAASVGSSCATASGTGDINTTVNVAAGGSVVIEITATLVDPSASTVVNSASVQPAAGVIDTNPGNNVSTLDLRVALFSDGFESAAAPRSLLKGLDSLSVEGAAVESKLQGAEPVAVAEYVGEGKALLLQAREVHGLVEVRLLQKTQGQPWTRSRWIELWPGDRVHLDYVNTGPQLEARVAVGQ